ncbi:zinc-ribbon domain-containing protein [Dehalococcoidia bacterium]|nr:zinc-ribbon domain-containing protein [Dehalococcoidia bacterium]
MTDTRNCGNCGAELAVEASFCVSCGASAQPADDLKCPNCGNHNPENAQFCGICGTSLNTSAAMDSAVDPGLPMVSFGDAISKGFTSYFTFSGRATRAELWWWLLFTSLIQLLPFIGWIAGLAVLIPSLSVTSRRLHDIGKTGWWQLVMFLGSMAIWGTFGAALIVGIIAAMDESTEANPAPWLWLAFVALIAGIALIAWWIRWLVRRGETGPNQYGPDPRQSTS